MSKYTTGEIASLCGVTVRTIQYYDSRGILKPDQHSEGGRRLYSEDDLKKMRIICFLRDMGISLKSIAGLLAEPHPEKVIHLLISKQKETLEGEISERRSQLKMVEELQKHVKSWSDFSVESISDIAYQMDNNKKLKRLFFKFAVIGIFLELIELGALICSIVQRSWMPFIAVFPVMLILAILISRWYFNQVSYICPECHAVFRPTFKEVLFAKHTPTTRKLTCTECGHHGFCVETYYEK